MRPGPGARLPRRCVRSATPFEKRRLARWLNVALRRVIWVESVVLAKGFALVRRRHRSTRILPQGGIPSVAPSLTYRSVVWSEYSWSNLNGRLIDHCELMAKRQSAD